MTKKNNIKKLAYAHNHFEMTAWQNGTFVCGIDEAGRGALAGPVVVAAVILPCNTTNPLLRDSKKMTLLQRNEAYSWITKNCLYTTVLGSQSYIDTHNIYQATKLCMHTAFFQLLEQHAVATKTSYIIADAMPLILPSQYLTLGIKTASFNYGESISASIAAASIVAKVTRDALMDNYAHAFPGFTFAQHKGYGTEAHTQELLQHGTSIIHRNTFTRAFQTAQHPFKQESLFA